MEKLIIKGGKKLNGDVQISGAKNAALPILAASILADGKYHIMNIPNLRDIATMNSLLGTLGIDAVFQDNEVELNNLGNDKLIEANYDLVKTMRASILVLGPILAKRGEAKVALPGGCAIGERPVDLHLSALEKMGADIKVENGYIYAKCDKLKGAEIIFNKITVTGTENIMMAATLAEGTTVLLNAAKEPEIEDLAKLLRQMGAKIEGDGSSTITIIGVKKLHSTNYSVMADRIEAGTFLAAVAATGGKIKLHNAPVHAMDSILERLTHSGVEIKIIDDNIIEAKASKVVKATNIETAPYPGFPTDMQAQFMALMLKSDGVSIITESIFENRFMHVAEFKRMGADITLNDSVAIIQGVKKFSGAPVMASDLRASAGLVIAALMAEDGSEVQRIYHLDRGYDAFEKKLAKLGANIKRVAS